MAHDAARHLKGNMMETGMSGRLGIVKSDEGQVMVTESPTLPLSRANRASDHMRDQVL